MELRFLTFAIPVIKNNSSVKKLRVDGLNLHTDFSVISYAKKNKMILITRDTESGEACNENDIPCILLDADEIFKIVLDKLRGF